MLLVDAVNQDKCYPLPVDYYQKSLFERLYHIRSQIPAVTHLDFSARVQTVEKDTNPRYHALLNAFNEITKTPILVNTSFNVRGEPIVCTPADAYRCFMSTEMDVLVMENFVYVKEDQPNYEDKSRWMVSFKKD
jgi:carbamoyltransferase